MSHVRKTVGRKAPSVRDEGIVEMVRRVRAAAIVKKLPRTITRRATAASLSSKRWAALEREERGL